MPVQGCWPLQPARLELAYSSLYGMPTGDDYYGIRCTMGWIAIGMSNHSGDGGGNNKQRQMSGSRCRARPVARGGVLARPEVGRAGPFMQRAQGTVCCKKVGVGRRDNGRKTIRDKVNAERRWNDDVLLDGVRMEGWMDGWDAGGKSA